MLNDKRNSGSENSRTDDHRGDLELQAHDKWQQPNLDRIELKIGAEHVNHPRHHYRAPDNLGALQECRQVFAPPFSNAVRFTHDCQIRAGVENLVAP